MKYQNIIPALAGAVLLAVSSCTPDDPSMPSAPFQSQELAQGVAYTVTVDADNTVTLSSLLPANYQCYWIQPNGRSQGREVKFQLPFAGTYQVTFGVATPAGVVFGEPYEFDVTTNNMSLLSNPLYTYLTGGVGQSKTWVPVDRSYGVGQCTGPVMYCNPDDVLNDGSASTDIGISHMVPNWDPGFQSWLIPANSPYMDSYMTFALDDKSGCTLTEYRGESGEKGASEGTTTVGKYTLNVDDKSHPTLSFSDCYLMHNVGFDGVCDNYTTGLYITELTPYVLQLATMRTNSEGAWWIIWNFVAADVQSGDVVIPTGEPDYINPASPVLPEVDDLGTALFTTDIGGVNFVGESMTYLISDEAAYDWLWWNGATQAWQSLTGGNYGSSWAPMWDADAAGEVELTLSRASGGTYAYTLGDQSGACTIDGATITFDQPVTLLTVSGEGRTVALTGSEWQVFKCDPGSELVIGIPDGTDSDGNANTYLVANLTYKAVGGAQEGPLVIPFDPALVNNYIEADSYFRCQLYNPWGGGGCIDPEKLKVKKNQTIKVTLRLNGFTFTQPAKMVLCLNVGDEQDWEPACFDYARAIEVNGNGAWTVTWTNDTGSTVTWSKIESALTMTMQYVGYATVEPDADGSYASACTVESIVVE